MLPVRLALLWWFVSAAMDLSFTILLVWQLVLSGFMGSVGVARAVPLLYSVSLAHQAHNVSPVSLVISYFLNSALFPAPLPTTFQTTQTVPAIPVLKTAPLVQATLQFQPAQPAMWDMS